MGGSIPPSVSPAAATAAAAPAAPAPVTAEATVVQLPDRLPEVTRPVVLTGTVAGQTPEGLTRIRTSAGELLLDSAAELPADKPVTVQLTPATSTSPAAGQAKPLALILLQALATPAGAGSGAASGATPGAAPGAATGPTPPAVLLPAVPPSPTPSSLPPLLPGTVVPALVLASGSGAKPPAPMPAGTPAAGSQAQPPTAPSPAGTAPAGGARPEAPAAAPAGPMAGAMPGPGSATFGTPVELGGDAAHPGAETPTRPSGEPAEPPDLPRGATVALKILTVTLPPQQPRPPGDPQEAGRGGQGGNQTGGGQPPAADGSAAQPDAAPDAPPDARVLRGTVAGSTPQGQPILATKQGMLALNVAASLPQGATVTAALTDRAQAATQAAATTSPGPPGPLGERDWPAMRQLMATLAAADPALAKSMQATMPQPNRKLTAALGFFLAAMRGGDAQGWLGDEASSALDKAGRRDLLERLEKDFGELRREAAEPLPGDWRSYTIPLMDANGPRPIKLHVHPLKEDEESGGGERSKPGSRFVIDLDLSRFGPMQLDGLVRPNHFDLILRSHAALPPELRVELIQVFADSVRAVGYTGGLSFQSGARSWVKLTRAGKAGLGVSA
ncbi:hypothetical protein VY88_21325 [Azospirillum thiophilum]|uniref:DNA polymerase III n=1 Tax=Azospirillum thiophilum TaxID=528244 RepID=A0AAC8W1G4_9PROT|nr:hypothetical protein [Azospirillum thiophilum]ALG73414.1 hypothetical protein AL072_20500 [Azospirillum thiophilum]KJR62809.1 hypothetical protein VY88_21325 [Azospirillum thiophilum]